MLLRSRLRTYPHSPSQPLHLLHGPPFPWPVHRQRPAVVQRECADDETRRKAAARRDRVRRRQRFQPDERGRARERHGHVDLLAQDQRLSPPRMSRITPPKVAVTTPIAIAIDAPAPAVSARSAPTTPKQ